VITFWVLSPLIVLSALGLLFAKRPVHAALSVAAVMIGLACLYASLQAQFLFVVQIIVYTGAIMMLFLFVLMLIGVDTSEELKETIKGHRIGAVFIGLAFAAMIGIAVGHSVTSTSQCLSGSLGHLDFARPEVGQRRRKRRGHRFVALHQLPGGL
jgi:NADH-quinone oxidoreductase subunit J